MGLTARSLLLFFLLFPLFSSTHAQTWQIFDLGTIGGAGSAGASIADNDTVAGWSDTASGERHPVHVCEDCSMTDAGTLIGGTDGAATGISSNGNLIVGYSGINAYGPEFREFRQGFLLSGGVMQPLGALYCPCSFNVRYGTSEAHGVNDLGQVVGFSQTVRPNNTVHAFLWQGGAMEDIGGGAGDWTISRAFAINNLGQVVGDFATDAGMLPPGEFDRLAFLWQEGIRQELGTLPGHTSSSARAINDSGVAAGWSGAIGGSWSHAVIWNGGMIQNLGTLSGDESSQALGINNDNQVVGWSGTVDRAAYRAFLWQSGAMIDLTAGLPADSGWELLEARDINNAGIITGIGLHAGQMRAFLLRPVEPSGSRRAGVDEILDSSEPGQDRGQALRESSRGQSTD